MIKRKQTQNSHLFLYRQTSVLYFDSDSYIVITYSIYVSFSACWKCQVTVNCCMYQFLELCCIIRVGFAKFEKLTLYLMMPHFESFAWDGTYRFTMSELVGIFIFIYNLRKILDNEWKKRLMTWMRAWTKNKMEINLKNTCFRVVDVCRQPISKFKRNDYF